MVGEQLVQLKGGKPSDGLSGPVLPDLVATVKAIVMLPMQHLSFAVDAVSASELCMAAILKSQLVIGIPLVLRQFAVDFGEGDEGGEVEEPVGKQVPMQDLEVGSGILGQLQGKGGNQNAPVAGRGVEIRHGSLMEGWRQFE